MGSVFTQCISNCSTHNEPGEVFIQPVARRDETDTDYRDSDQLDSVSREAAYRRVLSFRDWKGFKKVPDIHERYRFFKTLGKGSFGEVFLGEHIAARVRCAIKVIRKSSIQKHEVLVELMQNELKVLEEVSHPYIMRIFELLEDEQRYYIVSELIQGGELYEQIIRMRGQFTEHMAAQIVHQILVALNHMHLSNIIHRDIKAENILMESADGLNIKITDFGFACFFEPGKGKKEVLGSPLYMAPEIVRGEEYGEKVDIWSVGVITYILLSGRPPFKGKSRDEIFASVKDSPLAFEGKEWERISEEAKDFIGEALNKVAWKRATATELLYHDWLKQIETPHLARRQELDISDNIQEFRSFSVFQSGVLAFIANMKATKEELDQLKTAFLQMDVNRDGKLSFEEIRNGVDKLEGAGLRFSRAEYMDLMHAIDKDLNGYVDYQEFIAAASNKAALVCRENLVSAFRTFDRDGSGLISMDELKAVFHGKDAEIWYQVMEEVDMNGDNQISFDEFTAVMQTRVLEQHSTQQSKRSRPNSRDQ